MNKQRKEIKTIIEKLTVSWRQVVFYILALTCLILSLSAGLFTFLFWLLAFFILSLWLSGGWFFIGKENKKGGKVKLFIPDNLYAWISAPFTRWGKANDKIYYDDATFRRMMKWVAYLCIFAMVLAAGIFTYTMIFKNG
jgi:hypothetical protein